MKGVLLDSHWRDCQNPLPVEVWNADFVSSMGLSIHLKAVR